MSSLLTELKEKVIDVLNLQDISPGDIDPDEPLVGGRLEIDSIDVLEMVIMMERDYGLTIDNKDLGVRVFASFQTMADYIRENAGACAG
jgi:acyl carrier protein